MVDLKKTCKLCFADTFVESEFDVICVKCGTVAQNMDSADTITPKYAVSLTAESKLGSSNIVDSSLNLSHLNKKFTSNILDSTDVYLEYFSQVCSDLHMPKSIARNAFYIFQKLRHAKLGLGRTAVFCLVHAYTCADVVYDGDKIIQTIQFRFKLRRKITISQAIYRIKPVAIEMKLIGNSPDSNMLTFKKNISPDMYNKAMRILDSFSGNPNSQTKSVQEFLDAYDSPLPIMRGTKKEAKKK